MNQGIHGFSTRAMASSVIASVWKGCILISSYSFLLERPLGVCYSSCLEIRWLSSHGWAQSVTDWCIDWLTHWLNDCLLNDWLTNWCIDWQIDVLLIWKKYCLHAMFCHPNQINSEKGGSILSVIFDHVEHLSLAALIKTFLAAAPGFWYYLSSTALRLTLKWHNWRTPFRWRKK